MNQSHPNDWKNKLLANKRILFGALLVLILGIAAVVYVSSPPSDGSTVDASQWPTTTVQRGPLTINITESGTIRPREQVVLKNELEDPAAILFIVDEGKLVKKGELLVELDVTELENEMIERRIRVQNDEADLIHAQENMKVVENQAQADIQQAELDSKFAQQDLKKYLEGEYPKLLKESQAKITLAQEELSKAEEDLKWSQILFEEKYLAQSELQKHELAAKKMELNLELAQADLDLLQAFTKQRQIDQLESDVLQTTMALERTKRLASANIAQAKAELSAREAELKEESDRLGRTERQIARAKMHAPIDGMVLYASSVEDRWRRDDDHIETGTVIRERDEIIYLPTASDFNVNVNIPEVDLGKIGPGLPVQVAIDAMPGRTFHGQVRSIAQLPDSSSRYLNPNLKLYETVIELDSSAASLRNGMSCQAQIMIEHYEDATYVPIQSVVSVQGQTVVYVLEDGSVPTPRPVELGMDNSRFIHVLSGVEAGERILLAPPLNTSSEREEPRRNEETPPESDAGTPEPQTEIKVTPLPAQETTRSQPASEDEATGT